jgi:hypothetical protein
MKLFLRVSSMLAAVCLPLLAGCVTRTVYVQSPPPGRPVGGIVGEPPPPPQVDVVVAAPGPGYAWVGGYWTWQGRWVWAPGRWVVPPFRHALWAGGHWRRRGPGFVWISGGWR